MMDPNRLKADDSGFLGYCNTCDADQGLHSEKEKVHGEVGSGYYELHSIRYMMTLADRKKYAYFVYNGHENGSTTVG